MTVEDLLAIQNVIGRYAHIMDAGSRGLCSFEELARIFTADAVFDFSEGGGGLARNLSEIVAVMANNPHPSGHHGTNPVIDFLDADNATCLSKLTTVEHDGRVNTGHYFDEFVRTEEGWRIRARKATVYFAAGPA